MKAGDDVTTVDRRFRGRIEYVLPFNDFLRSAPAYAALDQADPMVIDALRNTEPWARVRTKNSVHDIELARLRRINVLDRVVFAARWIQTAWRFR